MKDRSPMKTKHLASLLFTVSLFICSCGQQHGNNNKTIVTTSRFQPGQAWTFNTSPEELPGAALTIAHVDSDPKEGPIVFILVTGARHDKWVSNNFLPLSEEALNRSVISLIRTNAFLTGKDLEDFQEFYRQGRQLVEAGKVEKCFKKTVAEILEDQLEHQRKGNK